MTTQEEIIEYYIKNQCINCKGKCNRGIVIIQNNDMIYAKCIDYEKDKDKIKKKDKPIFKTAKTNKPIMRLCDPSWY